MKSWDIFFRAVILIILAIGIAFNVLLYNFCEKQSAQLSSIKDKQDVEAEFNSNKFKFQQDQIDRATKDLENARQQIKSQNDALVDQRDQSRSVQTSLIDIKAESDAIKQDMKGWQKDYVSILAQLERKIDDSQDEIKGFENNLNSLNIPELKASINSLKADIEKISPATETNAENTAPPSAVKAIEEHS